VTASETWSRDEKGGKRLVRRRPPLTGVELPRWTYFDTVLGLWRPLNTKAAVLQLEGERAAGKLARVTATVLAGEPGRC
jgi:hypothetical protein